MSETPRKTPLYEDHQSAQAKIVEFAGWMMPVEYQGLRAEHQAVRSSVGLFDVSHMGELRVRGPKALESVEWLTTNHVARLKAGQAQYSLLPNETGGVVDDLIIYCVTPGTDYLLCVNAANTAKDFQWILAHNRGADITDESASWGQIAVQGPQAVALVGKLFEFDGSSVLGFTFVAREYLGKTCLLARTGYTGEDGFEIFVPAAQTSALWKALVGAGGVPIGLGARDTLRTEMKYSLYGHEIDDTTNPYAAGLGWVVKPDLKYFVGRQAILDGKNRGFSKKLVGFKMVDRGIARHGYGLIDAEGRSIGRVTSGTPSPTLNENIGIGYVDVAFSKPDSEIFVDIRGRACKAQVVSTPFVKETSLKK